MQVGSGTIPSDGDVVAANFFSLIVQWLRDVTEEVDNELKSLLAIRLAVAVVIDNFRVVGYGCDRAAAGTAISAQVHGARGRGRIFRVWILRISDSLPCIYD